PELNVADASLANPGSVSAHGRLGRAAPLEPLGRQVIAHALGCAAFLRAGMIFPGVAMVWPNGQKGVDTSRHLPTRN
ncbi:MAG: hypothetical protein ABIM89_16655, partial [Mycobacteriales bacterium]